MGNRSNSVYGPARRPIFDPAAVFGSRQRHQAGSPILEISWSWGGDIHPEDLAGNASPAWKPIDYGLLGGTPADIQLVQISGLWQAPLTAATTTITLASDSVGSLDTVTFGGFALGQTKNVGWIVDGGDRLWVQAASSGTTGDLIGHGLSFIARYRYIPHDTGPV